MISETRDGVLDACRVAQVEAETAYREAYYSHIDCKGGPDAQPGVVAALEAQRAAQRATADAYLAPHTARLPNGSIVQCEVVSKGAKVTTVRVPVLRYGVLSWDRLRVPNERMDPAGEACNAKTFALVNDRDALRAHVAQWQGWR